MYKVALYTLGCKVSLYESEAIGEAFAERGFEVVPFDAVSDVYVINTCTVTQESDAKSRKYIRRAIRKNPEAGVFVIGCYSQRSPEEVAGIEGVTAVLGTKDKLSVVSLAEDFLGKRRTPEGVDETAPEAAREDGTGVAGDNLPAREDPVGSGLGSPTVSVYSLEGAEFERMRVKSAERTRGYVKIEDGCECRCSYCAIADARGPVRSKLPDEVIEEVEGLAENGTLEVVLTGIETGSYGKDLTETLGRKYTLADLLTELDRRESCHRIRLGSMAPELSGKELAGRLASLKIMTPHIHLSIQSGSSSVLAAMKRRYNREMLIENIRRLREAVPELMITADLMVGFPGETEEQFLETLSLVSEARLLDAHIFAYSKRHGTPAASYEGQISEEEKRSRSKRLSEEKNRVRDLILDETVERGKPLSVILETCSGGSYVGHSAEYIEVAVKGEEGLSGRLVTVIPTSHKNGVIYGEIADIVK